MILCVDLKNDSGEWQKMWHSLHHDAVIVTPDDYLHEVATAAKQYAMVLLHDSVILGRTPSPIEELEGLSPRPYALVVSSFALPRTTSEDGLTHRTAIPMPNCIKLQHLQPPFQRLLAKLAPLQHDPSPSAANMRHHAWSVWEREAQPDRGRIIFPALAMLCQGYLVVHAAVADPAIIAPALRHMGWDVTAEQPDQSDSRREMIQAEWWKGAFAQCESLQEAAAAEGIDDANAVRTLLQGIDDGQTITVEVVVAAYRELSVILKSAPWPV